LPFLQRKGMLRDICLEDFDILMQREDPCMLYTRTQEGGKTRTVFGYPMINGLNESRFYRPLLEYQRKLPWRSSLSGPDKVNARMTKLIENARANKTLLASLDFAAYDASLNITFRRKHLIMLNVYFRISILLR